MGSAHKVGNQLRPRQRHHLAEAVLELVTTARANRERQLALQQMCSGSSISLACIGRGLQRVPGLQGGLRVRQHLAYTGAGLKLTVCSAQASPSH